MALTALETISQKLQEERDNRLESILISSGSAAIAKNGYNVTIVDNKNVASSLVFKELNKDKYDEEEIKKAINVNVTELKPNIPEPNLNLIPKPIYDKLVLQYADLQKQYNDLEAVYQVALTEIRRLDTEVKRVTIEKLTIEQKDDLIANQMETLKDTLNLFTDQIQTAVQKSVEESILRTSLQSQNAGYKVQIEALIKQIDSLNSIIEGLQAQLGAVQQQQAITTGTQAQALAGGADVINEVVILKINGPENDTSFKLASKQNAKSGQTKWNSGGTLNFTNNDKSAVTITLSHPNPSGFNTNWMTFPKGNTFTIAAGGTESIELGINNKAGDGKDSRKKTFGWSGSSDYKSELTVTVTKADSKASSKSYPTKYTKNHPDSF
jgi:hypothetical protein